MELSFDVSQDFTYGAQMQLPWDDFRPDYVVGVTGSSGDLKKEFYGKYADGEWKKKEGADIPGVEVALSGLWLEGAIPDKFLDISQL